MCRDTHAHRRGFGVVGQRRVFVQGDHPGARSIGQQLRLEGVNDEQQRQRDRDGLRKQEPMFTHVMMNLMA